MVKNWESAWHIVLGAPSRLISYDHNEVILELIDARDYFVRSFDELRYGLWRDIDEFTKFAPKNSNAWSSIRRVANLFDISHYIQMVDYLSGNFAEDRFLSFGYAEPLLDFERTPVAVDPIKVEKFFLRCNSLNRILALLSEHCFDELAIDPQVQLIPDTWEGATCWYMISGDDDKGCFWADYLLNDQELEAHRWTIDPLLFRQNSGSPYEWR